MESIGRRRRSREHHLPFNFRRGLVPFRFRFVCFGSMASEKENLKI